MIVPTSQSLTIWLAGDTIFAAVPPAPGHDRGHTIHVSADEFGLKNLLYVLRQRAMAREEKIGSPGAPTQYVLEQWAKPLQAQGKAPKPLSLSFDELELDL